MLAAAVLAVSMGAMIVYAYAGWTKMQATANLERDGSLAMQTMSAAIRGGASDQWFAASSSNVVYDTNNAVMWSFFKSGSRLVSVSVGSGSMDLVRTGVTAFVCTPAGNRVTVALNLSAPAAGVTMNMTNIVAPRILQ